MEKETTVTCWGIIRQIMTFIVLKTGLFHESGLKNELLNSFTIYYLEI